MAAAACRQRRGANSLHEKWCHSAQLAAQWEKEALLVSMAVAEKYHVFLRGHGTRPREAPLNHDPDVAAAAGDS